MLSRKLAAASLAAMLAVGMAACNKNKKSATPNAPKQSTAAQTNSKKADDTAQKTPDGEKTLPFSATGPVAKIDGKEITAKEFNDEVRNMMHMMPMLPPQALMGMKSKVLDNLISKKLVDAKVDASKYEPPAADVQKEFNDFKKQVESRSPGGLKQFYKRANTTEAKLKDDIKKSLIVKHILSADHDVTVSDADVKKYYDDNAARYTKGEQVKASHILLKLDQKAPPAKVKEVKAKAMKIEKEAKKKGADFAALAKKYSEGPSAAKGGDLGYFTKKRMVPPFADAAFKMKPGQISDPVRTKFGFHIIKVVDHKKAGKVPFDQVKDHIKDMLEKQKFRKAMGDYLNKLKQAAKIERMEQNIKDNPAMAKKGKGSPMMGMPGMGGPPSGAHGKGMPLKLKMPNSAPKK